MGCLISSPMIEIFNGRWVNKKDIVSITIDERFMVHVRLRTLETIHSIPFVDFNTASMVVEFIQNELKHPCINKCNVVRCACIC